MQTVPIKTEEQQAVLMLHRSRDLLIGQRTMLTNALRAQSANDLRLFPASDRLPPAPWPRPSGATCHGLPRADNWRRGWGWGWGQNSSGGKDRLGATAMIAQARRNKKTASEWLIKLLAAKPVRLVSVALANKMARIAWAILARGTDYHTPAPVTV